MICSSSHKKQSQDWHSSFWFQTSAHSSSPQLSNKRMQKNIKTQLHMKKVQTSTFGHSFCLCHFNSSFWLFWVFFSHVFSQNPNLHIGIVLHGHQCTPWGTAVLGMEDSNWEQRVIYNVASRSKGVVPFPYWPQMFTIQYVLSLKREKI